MPPQKILLIRHGETDWNVEGRGQGFARTDLNINGQRQAQALATFLSKRPISAIYSSDLPRTVQTAQPLADTLGIQPVLDERWREINLGIFEGTTYEEAKQRYPTEVAARQADYWGHRIPKGESRRDLQERAYDALQAVIASDNGREVVVVSHGGTLYVLLWKLFGEPEKSLTNTSISTLTYRDGEFGLESLAQTPHL